MRVRGYLAGKLSFSFDQIEFQAVLSYVLSWSGVDEIKK